MDFQECYLGAICFGIKSKAIYDIPYCLLFPLGYWATCAHGDDWWAWPFVPGRPAPQAACQQTPHKGQGSKANKRCYFWPCQYT